MLTTSTTQYTQYIVAAIVENKPGVLFRVTSLIRRRGYNIDSISVGPLEGGELARMTIVINGDEKILEQVVKQLYKLVEVIKLSRLDPDDSVMRELALIKVHASESKARSDVMNLCSIFRGHVIDVASDSMIMEVTGDPDKIDAFISLMKGYGIKEIARTGLSALARGSKSVRIEG
ncbi:MAG: acetolactate synthase small subunit [Candidatus Bathyarchaeia archaeon]